MSYERWRPFPGSKIWFAVDSIHRQVGNRKEVIYCYTSKVLAESDHRVDYAGVKKVDIVVYDI